jgi:integrase
VEGFVRWQLKEGYSIGSVNVRLSTVKAYAKLARKAGVISHEECALIGSVQGHRRKEARRIDEDRAKVSVPTRKGAKKAEPVRLGADQVEALKKHPDTPQGRRDAVMMCLLLDHGLRVGELVGLQVTDVNLAAGMISFYRPKVDKVQNHRLSVDTLRAVRAYFDNGDAPAIGPLLRASNKSGALTSFGMTERSVTRRVRELGESIGVRGLSAHDCRHWWTTNEFRNGTNLFAIQQAGGWNSLAMPRHYAEEYKIANEGCLATRSR